MQKITIQVPDNKMALFMELAHNLSLKFVDSNVKENVLTPEQIKLVNEERKKIKTNPEHFLDWDEVRKTYKLD